MAKANLGERSQARRLGLDVLRALRQLACPAGGELGDELFELGLLHRLDGREGIARYEIADPERHHHHVVDEHSGEVQPSTDERLEEAIAAVGDRLGMRLTSHEVILRGVPDRTSSQGWESTGAGQAAQALHAPCRTTSCSETSSATRSETRLIARSRPSSENGSNRPQRSHTR